MGNDNDLPRPEEGADLLYSTMERLIEVSLDYGWYRDSSVEEFRKTLQEAHTLWSELTDRFPDHPRLESFREGFVRALGRIGDRLFYDQGASADAIRVFEFALSIDPASTQALSGIVAAYLQGSEVDPEKALPYATRLAELQPRHDSTVSYIESLIERRHGE